MTLKLSLFLFFLLSFLSFNSVFAQKNVEHLACEPSPTHLPNLLGFKLQMNKKDVILNLSNPKNNLVYNKGDYGLSYLKLRAPSKQFTNGKFKGVYELNFDFVDEKLSRLEIVYTKSSSEHSDKLLDQTISSLNLPYKSWNFEVDEGEVSLRCENFSLWVATKDSRIILSLDSYKNALERLTRVAKKAEIKIAKLDAENAKLRRERKIILGYKNVDEKVIPCELTLAEFSQIRGFNIGMSYDAVKAKLIKAQKYYKSFFKENDVSIIFLRFPSKYSIGSGEVVENTISEEFIGIYQIKFSFFNSKLFEIFITYSDYRPQNLSDFLEQTFDKLKIPVNSWDLDDEILSLSRADGVSKCKDFKVYIYKSPAIFSHSEEERSFFSGDTPLSFYEYPSIRVLDTNAKKLIDDKEYEKYKKEEEKQQKLEQEKKLKQKEFKP